MYWRLFHNGSIHKIHKDEFVKPKMEFLRRYASTFCPSINIKLISLAEEETCKTCWVRSEQTLTKLLTLVNFVWYFRSFVLIFNIFFLKLKKVNHFVAKKCFIFFLNSVHTSLLSVLNISKFIAKCLVTSNTEKVVPPSINCPVRSNTGKSCGNSYQK